MTGPHRRHGLTTSILGMHEEKNGLEKGWHSGAYSSQESQKPRFTTVVHLDICLKSSLPLSPRSKMVALEEVQASNAKIAETYAEGLVAVFAGATAGIGETSLREFVRHAVKPRIYIIGRSKEACERLDADLKSINSTGEYIFIRSDASLLRNVDEICKDIRSKESAINVLFMSQGSLNLKKGEMDFSIISLPTAAIESMARLQQLSNY